MSSPPHPENRPQADDATWLGWIDVAGSEREVVRLCRDFLASMRAEELRELPETCRPREIGNASDLCALAYELVRHQCREGVKASAIALRLGTLFARANVRIAHLYRHMHDRELRSIWKVR